MSAGQKNKLMLNNLPKLSDKEKEPISGLYNNIRFLGKDIHKIMITSPLPEEGKTFVSVELWRKLSEEKHHTILLDLDMRRSAMAERYGMVREDKKELKGMSHCLLGECDIEEAIYQSGFSDADLLPNAENVVNPSLLLESGRFGQLLSFSEENYEYVLIDSPSLFYEEDTDRIAGLCDGAILVIKSGETSKRAVQNAISRLERADCPLFGIVLNRVPTGKWSGCMNRLFGRSV